jgi:hypothetical protein
MEAPVVVIQQDPRLIAWMIPTPVSDVSRKIWIYAAKEVLLCHARSPEGGSYSVKRLSGNVM